MKIRTTVETDRDTTPTLIAEQSLNPVTRERFDEYLAAWEDVIGETSTEWAPWHVVPADRNWVKSTAVAALLVDALERLDPKFPDAEAGIEGLTVT